MNQARDQREHHLYSIDEEAVGNPQALKEYEWAASHCKGLRVLDFGCNTGLGSKILLNAGADSVCGIDVSAPAIEMAKTAFKGDGRVQFIHVEGGDLGVEDESVDAIVALNIIEHLEHPKQYLEQMKCALKPGGILIISTVNRNLRLLPWQKPWNEFHYREYSERSLFSELSAFFNPVKIIGLAQPGKFYPYDGYKVWRRKLKIGLWFPLLRSVSQVKRKLTGAKSPEPSQKKEAAAMTSKPVNLSEFKVIFQEENVSQCLKLLAVATKSK